MWGSLSFVKKKEKKLNYPTLSGKRMQSFGQDVKARSSSQTDMPVILIFQTQSGVKDPLAVLQFKTSKRKLTMMLSKQTPLKFWRWKIQTFGCAKVSHPIFEPILFWLLNNLTCSETEEDLGYCMCLPYLDKKKNRLSGILESNCMCFRVLVRLKKAWEKLTDLCPWRHTNGWRWGLDWIWKTSKKYRSLFPQLKLLHIFCQDAKGGDEGRQESLWSTFADDNVVCFTCVKRSGRVKADVWKTCRWNCNSNWSRGKESVGVLGLKCLEKQRNVCRKWRQGWWCVAAKGQFEKIVVGISTLCCLETWRKTVRDVDLGNNGVRRF